MKPIEKTLISIKLLLLNGFVYFVSCCVLFIFMQQTNRTDVFSMGSKYLFITSIILMLITPKIILGKKPKLLSFIFTFLVITIIYFLFRYYHLDYKGHNSMGIVEEIVLIAIAAYPIIATVGYLIIDKIIGIIQEKILIRKESISQ